MDKTAKNTQFVAFLEDQLCRFCGNAFSVKERRVITTTTETAKRAFKLLWIQDFMNKAGSTLARGNTWRLHVTLLMMCLSREANDS